MAVSKPPIVRVDIPDTSYGPGRQFRISQISEHHAVGDAHHVISKARSAQFSCTFTIGTNGTIYQLVDIADTPYTDNDYRSNGRSITIEHAGGHTNFPYTEEMYQASIKLHAWLFQQHGQLNCVRHRDIPEIKANPQKATACPGGLDVERIVREAKKLLSEEEIVKPTYQEVLDAFAQFEIGPLSAQQQNYYVAQDKRVLYYDLLRFNTDRKRELQNRLTEMTRKADELAKNPTKPAFEALQKEMEQCKIDLEKMQLESTQDSEAGESFLRRLGQLVRRFLS